MKSLMLFAAILSGLEDKRVRHPRHDDDRDELQWIEPKVRIEILIDDQGRWRRCEERVAVGIGLRDDFRTNIAARSGVIFNDDRLVPFARQPLGDNARHDVGSAAGGKRHHDLDDARRVILRMSHRGSEHCPQ
jgi:hypothetical protein